MCPLLRDDTLNTSFAEYLAFSVFSNLFIFFTGAHNSVVPLLSEIGEGPEGARAPPALWRRRLCYEQGFSVVLFNYVFWQVRVCTSQRIGTEISDLKKIFDIFDFNQ